jgi:ligand-binding sensor domain-containing protein
MRNPPVISYIPLLTALIFLLAACAPGVGIFSSGTWQSGGLQHQHIRALTVDPNNPQNIYAGDAQNGVFTSTDGGLHWSQHSTGLPAATAIHALAFDDPGKKLYAASDAGVYVTATAALRWSAVPGLPADGYTTIAFDLKATQTLYVGTAHHGVLTSTNSGVSWSAAQAGLPAGVAINSLAFDPDVHQLWAATGMGVFRSPDDGKNWQALNAGLPAGINAFAVLPASIYGGDKSLVYLGTNQGFYRSQDDAARWDRTQTPLMRVNIYALLIDIHSASTMYVATNIAGVLRSNDNGQNWGAVAGGFSTNQPVYAIAQGASDYGQLFAAANDVYLFPGNSSTFDASRLIPLLLVVVFFFFLIRLTMRGRKRRHTILKPERIIESPNPEQQESPPVEPRSRPVSKEGDTSNTVDS